MTVPQMLVTERQLPLTSTHLRTNMWRNNQYLNSPYVTILHQKTTASNLMNTVDHAFGYRRKKFILTHAKSEVETSNILKLR